MGKFLETGYAVDAGIKRAAEPNQDSVSAASTRWWSRRPPLLVVADGMGGYEGGALASQIVVSEMDRVYRQSLFNSDYAKILQKGVLAAHQTIRQYGSEQPALNRMGSTVVAVVVTPDAYHLVNVGDSRAYIASAQEICQISWDHSLVGEMVRQGELTTVEAWVHPKRNRLSMSISVAREEVEIYTQKIPRQKDQVLVLCSDGLWGSITETQIQTVVLELPPQQAANKLVEMANTSQGPDNISVIVAREKGFKLASPAWSD